MPPKKKASMGALKQPVAGQSSPRAYQAGDSLVFDDASQEQEKSDHSLQRVQDLASSSSERDLKQLQASLSQKAPTPRRPKKRRSWLTTLFLGYLLYVSVLVCPNEEHKSDAVCRGLSLVEQGRSAVINKIDQLGHPYLEQAQVLAEPYWEPIKPHYDTLKAHVDPVVERAQHIYDTKVQPRAAEYYQQARVRAGPLQQELLLYYQQHGKPVVQRYTKFYGSLWRLNVAPALSRLSAEGQLKAAQGLAVAQRHFDAFQAEHFPTLHAWTTQTLYPVLGQISRNVQIGARTTYKFIITHVYPAIKDVCLVTARTVSGNVLPQLRRWHSLYITPQIERVKERIWQHRAEQLSQVHEEQVKERMSHVQEAVESAAAIDLGDEASNDKLEGLLEKADEEENEDAPTLFETSAPVPPPAPVQESVTTSSSSSSSQAEELPTATQTPSADFDDKPEEDAKAQVAAQRLAITSKHAELERELEDIAKAEKALLQERLTSAAERAAVDIEFRFEGKLRDLRSDSERNIKRLQRWAEKRKDSPVSAEEVDAAVNKTQSKVLQRAGELIDELDAYRNDRGRQAERAVEEAMAGIKNLLGEPRNELARKYAWLKDVTYKDWQRFHQLAKEEDRYAQEFRALATGQLAEDQLNKYEEDVDSVADDFSETTETIRRKLKGRAGSGPAYVQATESLSSVAEAASSTLASAVGASATPSNLQESAASVLEQASDKAADLVEAAADPADFLGSVTEALGEAPQSASAAFAEGSTSVSETIVDALQGTSSQLAPDAPSPAPQEVTGLGETIRDTSEAIIGQVPAADSTVPSPPVDEQASEAGDYIFASETPTFTQTSGPTGVRGTSPELVEEPTEGTEDVVAAERLADEASPTSLETAAAPPTYTPGNVHEAYSGVRDEL